ncbi:MAG: hypothetical protein AAF206_09480 [Bacteroidota bacterium]
MPFGENEAQDWAETIAKDSSQAYRLYLLHYPDGPHRNAANQRRLELKEGRDWDIASKRNTVFTYREYLRSHPKGQHAAEAAANILRLEHDLAWKAAQSQDSVQGYLQYKKAYPNGPYLPYALERITELIRQAQEATDDPQEERELEEAIQADSLEGYNAFLRAYPRSAHQDEVRERIHQLEKRLARQYEHMDAELQAWQHADKEDSLFAYREFLNRFPQGKFSSLAREREAWLEARLSGKSEEFQSNGLDTPGLTRVRIADGTRKSTEDTQRRDRQAISLSYLWLGGFGLIALLAWRLLPFWSPVNFAMSIGVACFFLHQRKENTTKRELLVYFLGSAIAAFGLFYKMASAFKPEIWVKVVVGLAGLGLVLLLMRHFFGKSRVKTGAAA